MARALESRAVPYQSVNSVSFLKYCSCMWSETKPLQDFDLNLGVTKFWVKLEVILKKQSMKEVCSVRFAVISMKFSRVYPQGYSQHSPLVMIENWKKILNKGQFGGLILTDLSKTLDYLVHYVLISNLLAYGFDSHSVNFVFSYFSEGSHTAKINSAFSNYL